MNNNNIITGQTKIPRYSSRNDREGLPLKSIVQKAFNTIPGNTSVGNTSVGNNVSKEFNSIAQQFLNKTNPELNPNINPNINSDIIPNTNALANRYNKNSEFNIFKFLYKISPYLITFVVLGLLIWAVWPYISSLLYYIFPQLKPPPPPPLPCGGCYNGKICDQKIGSGKCRESCEAYGESYHIDGDLCYDPIKEDVIKYGDFYVVVQKCDPNKSRCGIYCITNGEQECLPGEQICQKEYIAVSPINGDKKCCELIDGIQTIPSNGNCLKCKNICGDNCCDLKDDKPLDRLHSNNEHPGMFCTQTNYCCDPDYIGLDDVTLTSKCCQKELCGDGSNKRCCSGDRICNKDAAGGAKCQVKCGNNFCDSSSDICARDNNNNSFCAPNCLWDQVMYIPFSVYDKTNISTDPRTESPPKIKAVCLPNNQTINDEKPGVVVSDVGINLRSTTSVDLLSSEKNDRCKTIQACIGKIQGLGLEDAFYDNTAYSNIAGKCVGTSNCSQMLPSLEKLNSGFTYPSSFDKSGYYSRTICPAKNKDGKDGANCCYNYSDHKFNGKVCPDNTACYFDPLNNRNHLCLSGADGGKCNNNGVPSVKGNDISCTCNKGHIGKSCQYNDSNTCNSNGEVSTTADDKPICKCNPGYTGNTCLTLIKLNQSDLESIGPTESAFQYLYIKAGPGITFKTIGPSDPRITRTVSTNTNGVSIFGPTDATIVIVYYGSIELYVSYIASYKTNGTTMNFSGSISLPLKPLEGTEPVMTNCGTNNYVSSSAAIATLSTGAKPAKVILGIPIPI